MKKECSVIDLIVKGSEVQGQFDIETPEGLANMFRRYLEFMEVFGTWQKSEIIKGGFEAGKIVTEDVTTPLLFETFFIFCGIGKTKFDKLKQRNDMCDICELIELCINGHQKEGAAIGAFNASFISKIQNISTDTEKVQDTGLEQITGFVLMDSSHDNDVKMLTDG